MLNKLLKKGLMELLEWKRPKEIGRTNGPKYYKHHRISHPIEKCKALKEQVMEVPKERKVRLSEEDIEESD